MNHLFIAFEGLDGSGKSTQAKRLHIYLWPDFCLTREPTLNFEAPESSDPHDWARAYALDRRGHQSRLLRGLREGGVICDRGSLSMRAYQSASGCDLDWLTELDRGCLVPDLTIYLDVPVDVAVARLAGHPGLNHEAGRLVEVKAAYERAIAQARASGWRIEIVDGLGTEAEVADRVTAIVDAAL